MTESQQHKLLKHVAKDTLLCLGYNLVSFDSEVVYGYKPDLILENEHEVLFVEVVVTSDHVLKKENIRYKEKPVRFIKYYSLDSWMKSSTITEEYMRVTYQWLRKLISNRRINIPKELGWDEGDQLLLETYKGRLFVENLSKGLLPMGDRLK